MSVRTYEKEEKQAYNVKNVEQMKVKKRQQQ